METKAGSLGTGSDIAKLAKLVEGIQFAMLTTRHGETGELRSRPMTLQQAEFDGTFWIFTGQNTSAAEDIRSDARVNLAFADPRTQRYVSVTGLAELNQNQAKMRELWHTLYLAWFPLGLEDPNLRLLEVHVECVDYWESPNSSVEQLAGFAKAVLTGKAPAPVPGNRGHLEVGPPWH